MRTDDGYIIYQCLNGNSEVFGALVDKYKEGIFAYIYAKLQDWHDAQDVTQEVFIQTYRKLYTLKKWDSFAGWLYRIASNFCKNWQISKSKRPDREYIEDQDPAILNEPSISSYHEEEMLESVYEALNSLSDTYREVLTLYYFGGMDSNKIAEALGTSPTAIRLRLSRARAQLKKETMSTMQGYFDRQKLPIGFTFQIIETIEWIKIHPIPQTKILPWGLSLTTGIIMIILSSLFPIGSQDSSSIHNEPSILRVKPIMMAGEQRENAVKTAKTALALTSPTDISYKNISPDKENITEKESQNPENQPNIQGLIENRSALFKNRKELVHSRKPGSDCYGVHIYRVYVAIRKSMERMIDPNPFSEASEAGMTDSTKSLIEWITEKYPEAEIKILLDERINLSPGRRCRDFNGLGSISVLGRIWKLLCRDSPIKPSTVIFIDENGILQYNGISVNRYRNHVQIVHQKLGWGLISGSLTSNNGLSNVRIPSIAGPTGFSWGNGSPIGEKNFKGQSGFFESVRLINADPDNITIYPGELLDVSQPPFMSIKSKKQ